ncbi:BREX system P-loop protein BrxC [Pseudogracilibacillus sp. SO30301A]|uniref:BREX system P-loop protein BrxC n=1 Tax=Pseudogracilibacillus sp. SO30301A TaxID=3098291 RepID=UPI00300E03A6
MQIKNMFDRKIDREIKGVIKVGQDDDQNIKQELEEYVVTEELHKHIEQFFAAYRRGLTEPTDKIGVWISGFFGSGKSHFLKILSYLIENREIAGKHAIDYFENKITDKTVLNNLQHAGNVPSDVILFDIDAKSESDSMAGQDSIVIVLNKVFNEMQGFCGAIPWIAEMERKMQKDGTYEAFKNAFQKHSGSAWEDAREDFYYEEDAIIASLIETTQMSEEAARNWFERTEQEYSISIERFASRVKEYIETQEHPNHHVVFLIDEVGQYIGDDSRAMLNLQTIVHELGRQCKGKAWIAVTSQEDIDSVLTVKGSDFSKIQGRFDTKLSLSSAYVDEVIRKRILAKNKAGADTLGEVFHEKQFVLQSVLTFPDSKVEMKQFTDKTDFIDVYPFVPYQFNLLQSVFTAVRIHGASGKHLAEGERSLLSAFQESAIAFSKKEAGTLVPFSSFYETIEQFLDSSIRTVIIRAGKNEQLEAFDVKVLKLLFLIKYVKEIPATLEHIATLLVDHIDTDKLALKGKIEKSLIRLIDQTLIEKHGDEYAFLTNDEQDVNQEIKNIHIDSGNVIEKIGEKIFSEIYPDKKYRYSKQYDFSFNTIIDDRPIGTQSHDIGIRVLTAYADVHLDYNDAELKMMSMRENNVIVKLSQTTDYLDEMESALKIDAYLRMNSGTAISQTIEDIKMKKTRESNERKERVTTYLKAALKDAEIFVKSQQLDIAKKNPIDRINDAFHILIKTEYHKIDYIEKFVQKPTDLENLLTSDQLSMEMLEENKLARNEVNNYITRLSDRNQAMTLKSITTHFEQKPFGWLELDIKALLIELFKEQEIKLHFNSADLKLQDPQFIDYLTKRQYVERVIVKKRERISSILIKNVRDLSTELFNVASLPTDEDNLQEKFKEHLQLELEKIKDLLLNYRHHRYYPGESILQDGQKMMSEILNIQDTTTFYNKVREYRHDLRDFAEDSKEIYHFFKHQRTIFDDAHKRLLIFERNQTFITDASLAENHSIIEKIVKHASPYGQIKKLPALSQQFDELFMEIIEAECEPVKAAIRRDSELIQNELQADAQAAREFAGTFKAQFYTLEERLDSVQNISEAIAMEAESDRLKVRCMEIIDQFIEERERKKTPVPTGEDEKERYVTPKRKTKTLSKNQMIKGTHSFQSEADIDLFLDDLRNKLIDELDENTTINLV